MTGTPVLNTERLTLRKPDARDTNAFVDFLMSERAMFVGGPLDQGKAWRALASVIGHWDLRGFGLFTMERKDSGKPIGSVGPWYPGNWPEPELAWSVWEPSAEGKGFAFEAAVAVRDHLQRTLGWNTAVSYIDPENKRSVSLAERLGAKHEIGAEEPFEDEGLVYRHHFGEPVQ